VIANLSPSFLLLPPPEHQKQKGETFSQWLATLTGPSPAQLVRLPFFLLTSEKILWFVTLLQANALLHPISIHLVIWFCC
jgi:hypothetical protein